MSEIVKLPIYFIFDRRKITMLGVDYYGYVVETSLTVEKTVWKFSACWEGQHHSGLRYLSVSPSLKSEKKILLRKIRIDISLFLIRNGCESWRRDFSECFEESQFGSLSHISTNCTILFKPGDVLEGEVSIHDPESTQLVRPPPQLPVDLLRMLENPDTFADARLKCGTTEIPVHKCILSARSPVFDAMFKNKMKESQQGVVVIEDMEPDVLQAMLKYMYSGRSDHLTDVLAGDLLFAADKYQLEEFKSICVDKLKKNTTVNNVVRILVLGHLLDISLKTHATAFVCKFKKISELENTEGWKSLLEERPALAVEVLMAVVKNLQKC